MAERDVGNLRTRLSWEDSGARQSMTGFQQELRGLKSEMNSAKSAGKQYSGSLQGLRKQSDILNRTYQTQQRKVRELYRRYQESARIKGEDAQQTKNLKSQYNNATAQLNRTEGQLKDINRAIEAQVNPWQRLSRAMDTTGRRMQTVGSSMSRVGQTMTRRVSVPLGLVGAAALKTASDFEEGMADVQAKSGATGDEMEELEGQARELGSKTSFSAREAAEGMGFLAQAGYDVNETMETMPSMIDLATAANQDLGKTADITSNVLTGFNLEASESKRVADVLAESSSSANTNVGQLGEAMSYVAPVAEGAGLSLEETAAAVGSLSDAGIQGTRAGTSLRRMISSLQNPTGETEDALDDLNLSMEEVNPSAHSLKDIISTLEDAGIDSSQAMELLGDRAGPALQALLTQGTDALDEQTDALKDSDGAASDMADTMEDTAAGSVREFKASMEDAAIEGAEHLLPVFTDLVDGASYLIGKFGELDENTQKNIIKFGGLVAAAGPVLSIFGKLTSATGGLLRAGSKVTGMLGKRGGAGMLGALSGLTKGGVVGLAIGGLGALTYGAKKLSDKIEESKEANLDHAESLSDQAYELQQSKDRFDELSEKAEISNSKLAEMNDLNKRISESNNPGEIKQLKDRYEELAEKSGLSKDELQDLFEANQDIVDQTPDVETSVSQQGNAFVEQTDKVQEYINKLEDYSEAELKIERKKLHDQQEQAQQTINEKKQKEKDLQERITTLLDYSEKTDGQIRDRMGEIEDSLKRTNEGTGEWNRLKDEQKDLSTILHDKENDRLETLGDQVEEARDQKQEAQKTLDKYDETNAKLTEQYLKHVGINEESEQGLATLDKQIGKQEKTIEKLQEEKAENGKLSEKDQQRLTDARDTVSELENQRLKILKQTGLSNDLNNIIDTRLDKLDIENDRKVESLNGSEDINLEEEDILSTVRDKNNELLDTRQRLSDNLDKNNANKDKIKEQINAIDTKIGKNDTVLQKVLEELGIWEDVKGTIDRGSEGIQNQNSNMDSSKRKLLGLNDQAESYTQELGKDVSKNTDVNIDPLPDTVNRKLGKHLEKPLNVNPSPSSRSIDSDYSTPMSRTLNIRPEIIGGEAIPGNATGTDSFRGGLTTAGEKGKELARMGDKWSVLDYGLYNLPRGTEIFTNQESQKIMRSINNIPGHASGVSPAGESNRIANQPETNNNSEVISLLRNISKGIQEGKVIQVNGQTITAVVNEENALSSIGKYF